MTKGDTMQGEGVQKSKEEKRNNIDDLYKCTRLEKTTVERRTET